MAYTRINQRKKGWCKALNDVGHSELAIEAKGLVKAFGDHRAVDGVDLSIKKERFTAFRCNGAGKRQPFVCCQRCYL